MKEALEKIEAFGKDKQTKLQRKLSQAEAKKEEEIESIILKAKSENEKVNKTVELNKQKKASELLDMWANQQAKMKNAEENRVKNLENIKKHASQIGQRRPFKDVAPQPEH